MIYEKLYNNLNNLRLSCNGLYIASPGSLYQKVWVRDVFYSVLPLLHKEPDKYKQTYQSLLEYYIGVEKRYGKISSLIKEPNPRYGWRYPHPRFNQDLTEIHEPWGYKQWDAIFAFLYGICLGEQEGINIIRCDHDKDIINMLIEMADVLNFHNDPESGAWENEEGVRSSSVGIGVAALMKLNDIGFNVPLHMIKNGIQTLNYLFPRETEYRNVDMIQLSLIYPFNVLTHSQKDIIIQNVESELVREHGTIRNHYDWYFNSSMNPSEYKGNEAQWTLGDLFLSIIHIQNNNIEKGLMYLDKVLKRCPDGNIPELYVNGMANENRPLCWSVSLAIIAIDELKKKGIEYGN